MTTYELVVALIEKAGFELVSKGENPEELQTYYRKISISRTDSEQRIQVSTDNPNVESSVNLVFSNTVPEKLRNQLTTLISPMELEFQGSEGPSLRC